METILSPENLVAKKWYRFHYEDTDQLVKIRGRFLEIVHGRPLAVKVATRSTDMTILWPKIKRIEVL